MQIFVLDKNPYEAARLLDDQRVVKMVTESAQILSTVMTMYGYADSAPYKATHENHPCVVWAAESKDNYTWLLHHFMGLLLEYSNRYDKTHKCAQYTHLFMKVIDFKQLTEYKPKNFCNLAANKSLGIDFRHIEDVPTAYRLYLNERYDMAAKPPKFNGRSY